MLSHILSLKLRELLDASFSKGQRQLTRMKMTTVYYYILYMCVYDIKINPVEGKMIK